MSRQITIWTLPGCGKCEAVKKHFAGEAVEERSLQAARKGDDPDAIDVMAQLAFQDDQVPVIRIDGRFVSPMELAQTR